MASGSPPPPKAPNAPAPQAGGQVNPANQALKIFDRKTVSAVALASFVLSVVLLIVAAVFPDHFGGPPSRFFLFVCVSFTLAVFLWVLFPQDLQLTRLPQVDLTFRLAGPPVLFFLTLYVLTTWFPKDTPQTCYYPVEYAEGVVSPPAEQITYNGQAGHTRLTPVTDGGLNNQLIGLVARFDYPTPFKVSIGHTKNGFKTQEIEFKPLTRNRTITLSKQ
jgi:hypothetical protein